MIVVKHTGDFNKTLKFLNKASKGSVRRVLEYYGKKGAEALSAATPVDTGLTASSWGYEIQNTSTGYIIAFTNTNIQNGVPIALILQYGHGTRNGGWVQGRDYINPSIQPIFDKLANDAWREVATQ